MDSREQQNIQDLAKLGGLDNWLDGAICGAFCFESWKTTVNNSHHTLPITIYLPSDHKLLQDKE